ncbi:hypothetical protein ABZ541_23790 [Micromonospora sediminicola]|uniref:hypothetical protein n=1 Tax=Micromonospora sediminicola TaxID=946078 RepID=UPI0033D285D9
MTGNRRTSRCHAIELLDARHETLTVVAVASATGRPIHPYTAAEVADGVTVYTQATKARGADTTGRVHDAPK